MKRAIYLIPENLDLTDLTDDQQAAIQSVSAQWTNRMPGTITHAGQQVVDSIMTDNFDPDALASLGLEWALIGLWHWDYSTLTEIMPLDMDALYPFLPDRVEYDAEGESIGTLPAERRIPHDWSGWPTL